MFGLEDSPGVTAATRFVVWSIALATSIVAAHYARLTSGERVPSLALWGVSCEAFGWFLHQLYYWLWWRAKLKGNDMIFEAMQDVRSLTSLSLVFVIVGAVLILSPFLQRRVGRFWPVAAACSVVTLFLIGYGDIKWGR